jgi:hypothetical protein
MARALRDWEPRFDLDLLRGQGRLYEVDRTLYAVCLSGRTTLSTDRRREEVALGEAVAIPQGVAIDVEPDADFLCIRYEGPPPYHFRERFIQIWGFEHFKTPAEGLPGDLVEVIPRSDPRHRVIYAIEDVSSRPPDARETGLEIALMIGFSGAIEVGLPEHGASLALRPGDLLALGPGLTYAPRGRGRLGRLILTAELAHEARCAEREGRFSRPLSPEFPAPVDRRTGPGEDSSPPAGSVV